MRNNITLYINPKTPIIKMLTFFVENKVDDVDNNFEKYSSMGLVSYIRKNKSINLSISDRKVIDKMKKIFEVEEKSLMDEINDDLTLQKNELIEQAKIWYNGLNEKHKDYVKILSYNVFSPIPTAN